MYKTSPTVKTVGFVLYIFLQPVGQGLSSAEKCFCGGMLMVDNCTDDNADDGLQHIDKRGQRGANFFDASSDEIIGR